MRSREGPTGIHRSCSDFIVLGDRQSRAAHLPVVVDSAIGRYVDAAVVADPKLAGAGPEREPVLVCVDVGHTPAAIPMRTKGKAGSSVDGFPNVYAPHQKVVFVDWRYGNCKVVPGLAACPTSVGGPVHEVGSSTVHLAPVCAAVGRAVHAVEAVVAGSKQSIDVVAVCPGGSHFAASRSAQREAVAANLAPRGPKVAREPNFSVGFCSGVEKVWGSRHHAQGLEAPTLYHRPVCTAIGRAVDPTSRRNYEVLGLVGVNYHARQAGIVG